MDSRNFYKNIGYDNLKLNVFLLILLEGIIGNNIVAKEAV
jgi:hypothetical protein